MHKWILGLLNGHKITYFLKIKVLLYSINLKLSDRKKVRKKDSKNFLSEPDSSKTFWQLGCLVSLRDPSTSTSQAFPSYTVFFAHF